MKLHQEYYKRLVDQNYLYLELVVRPSLLEAGWLEVEPNIFKKKFNLPFMPDHLKETYVEFSFKPDEFIGKQLSFSLYQVEIHLTAEQASFISFDISFISDLAARHMRDIMKTDIGAQMHKKNNRCDDYNGHKVYSYYEGIALKYTGNSLFPSRASFRWWIKELDNAYHWRAGNTEARTYVGVEIVNIDRLIAEAKELPQFKNLEIVTTYDTQYVHNKLICNPTYSNVTHELCHYLIATPSEKKKLNYGLEEQRDDPTHFNYTREFATVMLHDYLINRAVKNLPEEEKRKAILIRNYLVTNELWMDFYYESYLTNSENWRTYRAAEKKVKAFISKTPENELDDLAKVFLHTEFV